MEEDMFIYHPCDVVANRFLLYGHHRTSVMREVDAWNTRIGVKHRVSSSAVSRFHSATEPKEYNTVQY